MTHPLLEKRSYMREKYVKMVMAQVANMIANNFTQDYVGSEPLMGWLAEGEVWDGEYSEEEIRQALKFAESIAPIVDALSYRVDCEE